ncbi:MAG: hypothetical protein ABFS39_04100 [Pseudomonadota bacterium]
MALLKKSYSSVKRVLHNHIFRVPLNQLWKEIHDELGVGELSSRHLILSAYDHTKLRDWFKLEAGADPLTTEIVGNRLQAAALVRDEKWATESVFSGMMQVNVISGVVPLVQGDAITPPGTLLEVSASEVLIDHIDTVVLVENGIVARYWHQCRIPSELSHALMVYRGHGTERTKTVRHWIKQLPSTVKKVGYFDFDPAGMGIAVDYEMDAILIPNPLDERLIEGINNKPESYDKQMAHRPGLGKQLPASCREVWLWMTGNNRKCAVTQERLLVMEWSLRQLSLN